MHEPVEQHQTVGGPAAVDRSRGLPALAGVDGRRHGEVVGVDRSGKAVVGFVQRLGGTRLGVLAIGRIVSPLQRLLYRRTGGRISLTGSAPVLLLTTVGRRTAEPRTVPLFYVGDGERLVVCNVNPGFERENPWTLNLLAEPHALVQLGRSRIEVEAHVATQDELDRYWPQLTRIWPAYQTFYERTGRRSVFVLVPDRRS